MLLSAREVQYEWVAHILEQNLTNNVIKSRKAILTYPGFQCDFRTHKFQDVIKGKESLHKTQPTGASSPNCTPIPPVPRRWQRKHSNDGSLLKVTSNMQSLLKFLHKSRFECGSTTRMQTPRTERIINLKAVR